MKQSDIQFQNIPPAPGVYLFRGQRNKVLYVGRATELRSRIRSYFSYRLFNDRGPRMREAIEKAKKVEHIVTDTILDAYILEANLIKKYDPQYNVAARDNTSFPFVVITKEDFPKVIVVRGRELEQNSAKNTYAKIYGPFPKGGLLRDALQVLRKILPYRDSCTPYDSEKAKKARKCLRAELGLCPGVCAGAITQKEYRKRIRDISLFFEGKKKKLIASLEKEMHTYAKKQEFEKAEDVKRRLFSLTHIQDAHLIKREFAEGGGGEFRIEGYDVAHIQGSNAVGVMVVSQNKEKITQEYRSFNIQEAPVGDDIASLKEILSRRLQHSEWRYPNLIVVDGGKAHLRAAEVVAAKFEVVIPVIAVVKDKNHNAREILGMKDYIYTYEQEILEINAEAHRFALSRHRQKRKKEMFS